MRKDMPYVLIFQDDVYMTHCILDDLRQATEHIPDDAEMIQISWIENRNSRKLKYNRVFNGCRYLGMVIVLRKGYQKILDFLSQGMQMDEIQTKIVAYALDRPLAAPIEHKVM